MQKYYSTPQGPEKPSHDAVKTDFILAEKRKMAFKTPLAPWELR